MLPFASLRNAYLCIVLCIADDNTSSKLPCALPQASASGLYIVEKIDLLIAYLIAVPVAKRLSHYFPNVSVGHVGASVG